jgi:hypothetical protein
MLTRLTKPVLAPGGQYLMIASAPEVTFDVPSSKVPVAVI